MTIKEVSEKFGISQDTLRYYERIGRTLRARQAAYEIIRRATLAGWRWRFA